MKTVQSLPAFVFESTNDETTMTVSRSTVTINRGQGKEAAPDEIALCFDGPTKAVFNLSMDEARNMITALSRLVEG